jgi:hypothetical protein
MLKSLFLIMASKRTMLWKDTMSRDKTRSWLPREQCSGRKSCQGTKLGHGFQEIFNGWKKKNLEGMHVEGCDRGKGIKM